MGLFSKSKSKSESDPAYSASQKANADLMVKMAGGAPLPPLPTMTAAQQGMGNMPAINANPIGLPAYLGGGQKTVFPAGLPNQLSMIANQLSAGGYGRPAAISQQLSGVYKPVTVAPALQAPTPMGFTASQAAPAAPVSAVFPWLDYSKAHPYTHLGRNYTSEAEGMRAWKDYLAKGSQWKASGSTATTPYTSPF